MASTQEALLPFLPDADLQIRIVAISTLRQYVVAIADLAAGKQVAAALQPRPLPPSTSTNKGTPASIAAPSTLKAAEMNLILLGMDSALKPFLTQKIHKDLTPILQAADPSIQALCTILTADMESLRIQAHGDYSVMMIDQSQFLDKNKAKMSPVEERDEILKLSQLDVQTQTTDANLTQRSRL